MSVLFLNRTTKSLLAFISFVFVGSSLAQSEGVELELDLRTVFDDNVFRVNDGVSDTIFELSPTASYTGLYGKHQFTAEYEGEYAIFTDNSDINYNNHKANAQLDLSITSKWSAELELQYLDRIEEAGVNNNVLEGATEFTNFDSTKARIQTAYGTDDAPGQAVLSYTKQDFNYSGNNQSFRDRTIDDITGTFYYRVAPKSRAIFEVRSADVQSDSVFGFNQSFEQISYLTGLTWKATAKTEGSLRVGYQDTDYDNPLIADLDGLSYFGDIDWRPDTDSIVNIALSRTARDNAELVLAGLETTDFEISWKNQLRNRLSLKLLYNYRKDEFGSGRGERSDDTNRAQILLTYQSLRWLEIFTEYEYRSRDSDDEIYQFDNNQFSIGVIIALD